MQQGDSGICEGTEVGSSGTVRCEEGDAVVNFPLDHLARLDEQLGRPKWVVPVRQDDDLERLLRASIRLCKEGNFYIHVHARTLAFGTDIILLSYCGYSSMCLSAMYVHCVFLGSMYVCMLF